MLGKGKRTRGIIAPQPQQYFLYVSYGLIICWYQALLLNVCVRERVSVYQEGTICPLDRQMESETNAMLAVILFKITKQLFDIYDVSMVTR